ncbi:hypothetical protein J3F84DRAFT_373580 [Trichoderma pleuroticola]
MPLLPIPSTPGSSFTCSIHLSKAPCLLFSAIRLAPLGLTLPYLLLYFAFALPCPVFFVLAPPSLLHFFHQHLPSFPLPVFFVFLFVRVFARHLVKAHTRHCRSFTYLHRLFLLAQPSSAQLSPVQPSPPSLTAQILTASFSFSPCQLLHHFHPCWAEYVRPTFSLPLSSCLCPPKSAPSSPV